jgi:hypothetical protein
MLKMSHLKKYSLENKKIEERILRERKNLHTLICVCIITNFHNRWQPKTSIEWY